MSYIDFTDETGYLVLTNNLPAPANRFNRWHPDVNVVGTRKHGLGNGIPYINPFRDDQVVTCEITQLSQTLLGDCMRFIRWAKRGGAFRLFTEDAAARMYNCHIPEGMEPQLSDPDEFYEWTLTVVARNDANTPMICVF